MPATPLPLNRYPEDRQVTHRSLRLTRTWRPPGLSVPPHEHELACLALCLDGRFDETIGDTWHQIGPEMLVVRPGGVPHANRYASGNASRALIVEFLPDAQSAIRDATRLLHAPALFESPRFVAFGRRLDAELRTSDTVSGLAIEALVYDLIVSAVRETRSPHGRPAWLRGVREFLNDEFGRRIGLADIAAVADVHPSHLARTFRQVEGMTIGEYVRRLRTERAATLLRDTRLPVVEIAQACGFHDQSHLSRVFAARFGLSPRRYRSARTAINDARE
jgi:AraC family transcriptional regulator